MKEQVDWITDALSTKNIAREMTHYRVQNGEIRATDGRLTAGCPFPYEGSFLVPGAEFEKLIKRLPGTPELTMDGDILKLRTGRSNGTIRTLPIEMWDYPGVGEDEWEDVPEGLVPLLRDLRPFVSDNATHSYALGIALDHGYAYATNNIALAGVRCDELGEIRAILPVWAADFVMDREEALVEWAWTESYLAFRWSNGAWMRAQLIDATFPEQAVKIILSAEQGPAPHTIDNDFREAFARAVGMNDGAVSISRDKVSSSFGQATFEEAVDVPCIDEGVTTVWASKYIEPVLKVADGWDPTSWPRPALFRGTRLFGVLMGRRE